MTESLDHLEPYVANLVRGPVEKCLEYVLRNHFLGYPRAIEVINRMDQILHYPRSFCEENILLRADPGNGKSTILRAFRKKHRILSAGLEDDIVIPIVAIEIGPKITLLGFYKMLLEELKQPFAERAPLDTIGPLVLRLLKRYQVRVIVIDEFSNVTGQGKATTEVMQAIRHINNRLEISFIVAGTDAAANALKTDEQMDRRFVKITLPPWTYTVGYRSFLLSYQRTLPLALPSGLGLDDQFNQAIYAKAGESIGATVRLLRHATIHAIRSGEQRLTLEAIKAVDLDQTAQQEAREAAAEKATS